MSNIPAEIPAYVLKAQELQYSWSKGLVALRTGDPSDVGAAQKALDTLADILKTSISLKPPAECRDLHNALIQTLTGSMNAIISRANGENSDDLELEAQENYSIFKVEMQRLADRYGVG